jgi:hypothetical protein
MNDVEVPVDMSDIVSGTTPPNGPSPSSDPATTFFINRLEECYENIPVRDPRTGRLTKMNTHKLFTFLSEYADDDDARTAAMTTFYRLAKGEMTPRIDMVCAIAKIFGVPPSSFLPDQPAD